MKKGLILTVVLVAATALVAAAAMASPGFVGQLPADKASLGCAACHSTIPALNDAGKAFKANGFKWPAAKTTPAPAKPAPAPAKPKPAPAKGAPVKGILVKDYVDALAKYGYKVTASNTGAVLTREQAAALLVQAMGLKTDGADLSVLNKFADRKELSKDLEKAVAVAVKEGLFVGYGKTFGFKDPVTANQLQAIRWRIEARLGKGAKPAGEAKKPATVAFKIGGVEGYVGSETCGKCHPDAYASWKKTAHAKMIQKAPESVLPEIDWSKQLTKTKDQSGNEIPIAQFNLQGIKVPGYDKPVGAPVILTLGSVHKQRFLFDTNADNDPNVVDPNDLKIYPQEWIRPAYNQGGIWQDYNSTKWADWRKCAGCHATGVKADVATGKVQVNEFSIGCEACHGPGAEHAKTGDKTKIYKSANAYACGSCHTRGWNSYTNKVFEFIPNVMPWDDPAKVGDRYTHAGEGGNELDAFWGNDPKNPSKKHHQQYLDWRQTGHATIFERNIKLPNFTDSCLACHSATAFLAKEYGQTLKLSDFKEGGKYANDRAGVTCVVCHASHTTKAVKEVLPANLRKPREETCVQCHKESGLMFKGVVTEPMKGKKVDAVSIPSTFTQTCVDCHMPKVAKSGVNGDLSSHQFLPITKSQAAQWKLPAHTVTVDDELVAKKRAFDEKVKALQARVSAAEEKFKAVSATAPNYQAAKEALDAAIANSWYLYKDPGAGYHNLPFAEELLNKANANLDKFDALVK